MRARRLGCLAFFLIVLAASIVAPTWAYDRPDHLRLAAIPANPLNQVGIPLMQEIYQELGITIDVVEIPPAREVSLYSGSGELLDGTLARVVGFRDQAPQAIRIPVALAHINLVAFSTLEKLPKLAPTSDHPIRVGQLRGIDFGIESSKRVEIISVNTTEQLMAMLARQRIDMAIASELGGAFFVKSNGYENVRIVAQPLKMIPVYHYLHRKHEPLVPEVTQVMTRLHDSGYMADQHNKFRALLELEDITLPLSQQVSNDDLRMK